LKFVPPPAWPPNMRIERFSGSGWIQTRRSQLDFMLQLGQRLSQTHHSFEGIYAFKLPPTCAGLPCTVTRRVIAPRFAFQTTPPVGRGQHADRARPVVPLFLRSASRRVRRFLVRHKHQTDPAIQFDAAIANGLCGVNHGRQAALHVRRSASKKILTLDNRLEQVGVLRRNNIVVAAEIECPIFPLADERH